MFGAAAMIVGLQLLALAHGDFTVKDVQPPAEKACGPIDIVCIITELLDSLRELPAINPVKFSDIDKNIDNGHTRLHVALHTAILEGIPDFVVQNLRYSPQNATTGRLDLTLTFPTLDISAPKYIIRGVVAGLLILDGEGPLLISVGNVTLNAFATIKLKILPPGVVAVENLNCDVHAEYLEFKMTDILGELSNAFNEMMSEIGLDILALHIDGINSLLANYLSNLLNNLITGGSLNDGLMMNSETAKILAELTEKISQHLPSQLVQS